MTAHSRVRSVTPLLVVSDLKRSIDFYCGRIGFVEPGVHGDPPCFAMMNRDGFDLMLKVEEEAARARPGRPATAWDIYVVVSDLEAEIAALAEAGVSPDKGPTDTLYGMREIEVLDPDGHRLCFAQDVDGDPWRNAEVFAGVLDVGAAKFRLVLKLAPSGDGLVGRLDSPDQGAANLPIDLVTRQESLVRFEMRAIGAGFEGTLSEDGGELAGRWNQRGRSWPLVFRRS